MARSRIRRPIALVTGVAVLATISAATTASAIFQTDHGRSPCTRPLRPFTTKR